MRHDESTTIVNLSDASVKRRLMVQISKLTGLHEVKIKPRKRTRTLDQNSYYFVAVVQPFRDWLRDEYGDALISSEQAHEMLKVKMLGMDEKLIEGTQEVLKLIPRSKTLDAAAFGSYIDRCGEWLADFTGIVIVPSELFYESEIK
jgi:hypothetical protein